MVYSGADHPFLETLTRAGVAIVERETPLKEAILAAEDRPGFRHGIALGVYLRYEVPLIETEDDFCLYTDSDVMFLTDPDPGDLRPALFAAAPEGSAEDWSFFNSGVMLMNVPALRAVYDGLMAASRARLTEWRAYDQGAMNDHFAGQWDRLPLQWNWKPYWGVDPTATVLHFHGPKYEAIRHLLGKGPAVTVHDAWRALFEMNPAGYAHYFEKADALLTGDAMSSSESA